MTSVVLLERTSRQKTSLPLLKMSPLKSSRWLHQGYQQARQALDQQEGDTGNWGDGILSQEYKQRYITHSLLEIMLALAVGLHR